MYKVTIEDLDNKMKCEVQGPSITVYEVAELFKQALLGVGFAPKNVEELFKEDDE